MFANRKMVRFLAIFVILINVSFSWKILQIIPAISDSHVIFNYKFAQMLHDAGHDVTLLKLEMPLGKLKVKNNLPKNIEEICFNSSLSGEEKADIANAFQDIIFKPLSIKTVIDFSKTFDKLFIGVCRDIAKEDNLLEKLKEHKFDLAIGHFATMCPVGIAKKLNVSKFIWVVPGTFIVESAAKALSIPTTSSYIPYTIVDASDRMSFMDRTKNAFMQLVDQLFSMTPLSIYDRESEVFRNFPENDFPHLLSLAKDTRALLINGEDFLDFPRPLFTNTLHIGDLGHKEANKLNQEWQSFMDSSKDGVIMFSLGTVANTSMMPIEMKEAFLRAFSQFPTYSIIWRLEGQIPEGVNQQKHIKVVKWMPQIDLLNHPKMKLFITHGGYNSVLETAQAGVPMILIPLFADQYGNARRAERYGLGLTLNKLNADSQHIVENINKVLTHESYQLNSQKFASVLRDKIISSENFTLHVLDKIIRSPNLPLVRAPQKLNLFQYFCIDIIIFHISVLLLVLYLSKLIIVRVYKLIRNCSKNETK